MLRSGAVLVAALVFLGACITPATDATAPPEPSTETTVATTVPGTTEPTIPPTTATTLLPGSEELPEEMRSELAELVSVTEEVRELAFLVPPTVVVVTGEELAERVRDQIEEDLADLPADQALYRLLGLIADDTDLARLYLDLYSEQVAGYYDGETEELVVPMAEGGFTAVQRATLVHELTHALTDQHLDFHDTYSLLLDEERYDEASAYQSLIEGDAVLTELLYLSALSATEQGEFFAESFDIDTAVLETAPRFIRDALVFPYTQGFAFVQELSDEGGFESVGEAYAQPPASTEQIINPADYGTDEPVPVDLPKGAVPEGYELEYTSTWGELGFSLMFDQVLGEQASDLAAGGWGGDAYSVWFDGADVVILLVYRGDTDADAAEIETALGDYVAAAMDVVEPDDPDDEEGEPDEGEDGGDGDSALVRRAGNEVTFVASSDPAAFADLVESIAPEG